MHSVGLSWRRKHVLEFSDLAEIFYVEALADSSQHDWFKMKSKYAYTSSAGW